MSYRCTVASPCMGVMPFLRFRTQDHKLVASPCTGVMLSGDAIGSIDTSCFPVYGGDGECSIVFHVTGKAVRCVNDATRAYINKVANAVRSTFDVSIPIDNIDRLVNNLGGSIIEKPGLDQLYDGTIKKVGDNSFEIAIFPYQGDERRNFTIAHELGHLFLHMGYLISKDTWDQQSNSHQFTHFGTNEQEYQANEFATALLMPHKEFKEKIEEYSSGNFANMAQVANYFRVSISAATNHGRFLGYLQ